MPKAVERMIVQHDGRKRMCASFAAERLPSGGIDKIESIAAAASAGDSSTLIPAVI